MQELSDTVLESCHLCVLSGPLLTVIAQAESPEAVRLSVEVGYQALPLNTVSGRLMVAFLSPDEQGDFLKTDAFFRKLPARKQVLLRAELTKIRNDGYHVAPSSRRTGLDASCLVGNPRVGVLAALGVPFIPGGANDGKERKLIPVIQRYADRITASLGLSKSTI
jgi:DNA-binding IclR family transcriptional regulator